MSQREIDLIRAGFDAVNRGDTEAVLALLDPAIEWEPDQRTPFAGTHRGREAVRELMQNLLAPFDQMRMEPEQFFEIDDKVVVFVRQVAKPKGSEMEMVARIGYLWTIRDGKAIRCQVFGRREEALEAAGIDPGGAGS
jgi:uncharacterized protein